MSKKIIVPPIKSQGIKTKLTPWINDTIMRSGIALKSNWYEPFFGTGVVGFNSPLQGSFFVGDTNPHIINFYNKIKEKKISKYSMREYLEEQHKLLSRAEEDGYVYYREVKDRFNETFNPYDFIFLSRAGFNGMMRFNKKGQWNIPFCKKPDRFAPSYITKICNQLENVHKIINSKQWNFINSSFENIIEMAGQGDLIYCDPPYYGRYVDYYNGWTEKDEENLFHLLSNSKAKFILSTWHHNSYRKNEMIDRYWNKFNILTKDHFYHSGAKIENRQSVVEALVCNFDLKNSKLKQKTIFNMEEVY
jgi:DNA adenine methylase